MNVPEHSSSLTEPQQPMRHFRRLPAREAAMTAVAAANRLTELDVRDIFAADTIASINDAVYRRRRNGYHTKPTDGPEVKGLVRAALGGHDHMTNIPDVRVALENYAIGFLQTDVDTIELYQRQQPGASTSEEK